MIPLFGPGWGNYAIRGIVEIELPEPASLLPQTPGWWVLLALGAATLVRLGWLRLRRWQGNRYRREALTALRELRTRVESGDDSALLDLAPLLRATAIQATSREDMAGLRGDALMRALAGLAPEQPALPVEQLQLFAYAPPTSWHADDYATLFTQLQRWIEGHHNTHA